MNNLYRGPSIYVSWGVSVHFFRNGLIRKKDLPAATMFANGSGRNEISSQRTFQQTLPTKFPFIWPSGFRVENFKNQAFRKKNCMCRACFFSESSRNKHYFQTNFHRCYLLIFGSFGQAVSVEKIIQKSINPKQEFPVAVMFINESEENEQSLWRTVLIRFGALGKSVSGVKIVQKSANQKQ